MLFFLSTNFYVEILELCGLRRLIDCEDFFFAPVPFQFGRSRFGFFESFYFALITPRVFEGFVHASFCCHFVGVGKNIFWGIEAKQSLLLGALQTKIVESEPTFEFLFTLSLDWCLIVLLRTIFGRQIAKTKPSLQNPSYYSASDSAMCSSVSVLKFPWQASTVCSLAMLC
jgi:hypothetical protein